MDRRATPMMCLDPIGQSWNACCPQNETLAFVSSRRDGLGKTNRQWIVPPTAHKGMCPVQISSPLTFHSTVHWLSPNAVLIIVPSTFGFFRNSSSKTRITQRATFLTCYDQNEYTLYIKGIHQNERLVLISHWPLWARRTSLARGRWPLWWSLGRAAPPPARRRAVSCARRVARRRLWSSRPADAAAARAGGSRARWDVAACPAWAARGRCAPGSVIGRQRRHLKTRDWQQWFNITNKAGLLKASFI